MDQQFEWTLHEREALEEGLEPAIIDLIRHRRPVEALGEKEASIVNVGRELFQTHKLSAETYATAHALFGTKTVIDLVCLMGNYAATALLLSAVDQQLPEGMSAGLPIT
jgi:4-carboxymuconolactone decarboxylase